MVSPNWDRGLASHSAEPRFSLSTPNSFSLQTADSILLQAKIAAHAAAGFPITAGSYANRERWAGFMAWRRENPSLTFKAGDEVASEQFFHRYAKTCNGGVFLRPREWMERRAAYMRRYRKGKNRTPAGWFKQLTNNAKARGLEVDSNPTAISDYYGLPCFYCGDVPLMSHGIDRVENSRGYVRGNMVPCCTHCNIAKGQRSSDDFAAWVHRTSQHLKNKGG